MRERAKNDKPSETVIAPTPVSAADLRRFDPISRY